MCCTPPEQPAPERESDVSIVVPSLSIDRAHSCCPGCEEIDLSRVPLIPVEEPMENPFIVGEGEVSAPGRVRGQHAIQGHHAD